MPRGVRYVDGPHAGETEADVILGQQKALKSSSRYSGSLVRTHSSLVRVKLVSAGLDGQLHQPLRADGLVQIAALSRACADRTR